MCRVTTLGQGKTDHPITVHFGLNPEDTQVTDAVQLPLSMVSGFPLVRQEEVPSDGGVNGAQRKRRPLTNQLRNG
jgi:hypothetical protein